MKKRFLQGILLWAVGVGLGSCMTDDLRLMTQSPFSLMATSTPALVQVNDTIVFRLTINPSPYLTSSTYRVSYQNTAASLPVHVKIGRQSIEPGEWQTLGDLSSLIAIRCDAVGQPKLLFYVKNQAEELQTVEVGFATTAK